MASDLELAEVAANVARVVYLFDNANHLRKCVLIEPARANKIPDSRNLAAATWTTLGLAGPPATVAGGPGVTTTRITENTANSGHEVRITDVAAMGLTSGVDHCCTVIVKAGTRDFLAFFTTMNAVNQISYFDALLGANGTVNPAHAATFKRELAGGSWMASWRFNPVLLTAVRLRLASANGVNLYLGESKYLDVAWAQITEGAYPVLPIESVGGALTKPADVDFIDVAALATPQLPLDPDVVRTEYSSWIELGTMGIENGTVEYFGNDLNTGVRQYIEYVGGLPRFVFHNGVTSVHSPMAAAPAWNDYVESRVECRRVSGTQGTFQLHMSLNEAAEMAGTVSDPITLPAAWGGTRYYRGSKAGADVGHVAHIKRVQGPGLQPRAAMRQLAGVQTFEGWGG